MLQENFLFSGTIRDNISAAKPDANPRGKNINADLAGQVAAIGKSQRPMTELAMRLGGHARVGLEDNIYLDRGVLSEGSAPLVLRAAAYARAIGRETADPARARTMLGMTKA